ncbi:putative tyrosine-protein phosphatase non-receptor type 23 [Apostichopus japonicus]|uniref:Putative tyrosine-protein phosphatase non-receptor type 23 n=1 Tax=Stichopus japonicus TaxID=307972 RepID=A0A2G8LC70_STIJA|nr:putative tyrosine-protein phosphatase non-receptor type 23 [Apostichopus japonicus]
MEDGEKYNEEIRQIEQFRTNAMNASRDFNGISTLKKYYGQLHNLASRFPMEEGGEAAIYFSWIDTFDEEPFTHADIRFEQACILYNLGALHAVLGARENRTSEEEMKVACTHFQCAAGIFTYLKENFQSDTSPDISFELMAIYIQTMLGQAQECLLEKSMQDNRKSSLVARISTQVMDYYQQALRGLEDINITSLLGSRRTKLWKRTLTVKMLHFSSISYLYMSNQSEEQQKFGERVAYLQEATNKHNEAMKMSKGQHESVLEALNFAKDVIIGKFQSAKKDNDFVYHEKVPDVDSLPEIKGASLVKALVFQPYDESVAGPDVFRKLVPMEAHEASSMYSEEKAKLLRKVAGEIEEKDGELEQYMSALQVEQLKLGDEEPERLPQILLEVCAAISVKEEPIKTLVTSMQDLSTVVLDVDSSLTDIADILEEEENTEKQFQKDFGPRSARNYDEIKKDLTKCKELHSKASQSNTELRKAMGTHMENIKILACPIEEIQAALPSLRAAESSVDKDAEANLKRLLVKVDEMKKQRKELEQQLRESIQKDDVTNTIATQQQGNLQAFFQQQLEKHSPLVTYLSQNLGAQDNILRALTDANASYADSRKVTSDTKQKREDKIQELITSYTVYDDLIAKSLKGIDFYKKLEGTVTKLLAKTKELVEGSQKERSKKISTLRAPQRPFAPKPVAPGPEVPQGPKLSDFWKPKSSPDRKRERKDMTSTLPGTPSGYMVSASTGVPSSIGQGQGPLPSQVPMQYGHFPSQAGPVASQTPQMPPVSSHLPNPHYRIQLPMSCIPCSRRHYHSRT